MHPLHFMLPIVVWFATILLAFATLLGKKVHGGVTKAAGWSGSLDPNSSSPGASSFAEKTAAAEPAAAEPAIRDIADKLDAVMAEVRALRAQEPAQEARAAQSGPPCSL